MKEQKLRDQQHELFLHTEDELKSMIRAIKEAQAITRDLAETQSSELMALTQISTRLLTHGVSTGADFNKMTPILMSFAAVAGQNFGVVGAEEHDVSQLTSLLEELLINTKKTL